MICNVLWSLATSLILKSCSASAIIYQSHCSKLVTIPQRGERGGKEGEREGRRGRGREGEEGRMREAEEEGESEDA